VALYSYKIGAGFNAVTLANIETIFRTPPKGLRLPVGAVTRVALSGKQRTDGERIVIWHWDVAKFSQLDTFVTTYLSNWDTESAEVTIGTRYRDNDFSADTGKKNWNAILYLPLDRVDYNQDKDTYRVLDLNIRFRVIEEAT
jgi:hypothetical protein